MRYLMIVLSLAVMGGLHLMAKPQRGERPVFPIQAALDANGDGQIAGEELAAATVALRKLDRNGDGRLTEEELRPVFGGPGRRGGPPTGEDADVNEELVVMLMGFDANKDGKLTRQEVPERMQGIFTRADANKDGLLTREELTAGAKVAVGPAANARGGEGDHHDEGGPRRGPGGGGRGDMMRAFPLLVALDADGDRVISATEIANATTALRSLDKDGDGRLGMEEIRPAFGRGPGGGDRD